MTQSKPKKPPIRRMIFAIVLLSLTASHGVTGMLAWIGWYDAIGINFDAWYLHPAYQSLCWFLLGISLTILVPMWYRAVFRGKTPD